MSKSQSPSQTPESSTTVARARTAVVSRQFFVGKEPSSDLETKNEELRVNLFIAEPAKVSVSQGLTLNLGNYESARIDVSVVIPCYREEVDEAYKYAQGWVEERLGAEVRSVRQNKPNLF